MSTVVASCTPMCRSPVLPASSGKQPASRSWRPAAAFPTPVAVKCRRPLSVTCALPEKQRLAFSIPPTALLYPVPPPDGKERWDIKEEEDHVKLWFQVPGLSEDDIEVNASEDMLEIKRKGAKIGGGDDEAPTEVHGVGSFHIRLLMTKEYDSNNVTAELKAGMLVVTVGKSKQRRGFHRVGFGPQSLDQGPVSDQAPGAKVSSPNQQAQGDDVQKAAPVQPKTGLNQTQRAAAAQSTSPFQQAQGDDVQKATTVQPKTGLNQTQRAAAAQSAGPFQQAQGDDVQKAAPVQPKTGLNQTQRAAAAQSASPFQQAQGDDVQKATPVQPKTGLNQTQRAAAAQSAGPFQQAQGDDVQKAAPVQPKTGLNQTQRAAAAQSASPNQQAQGDDVQKASPVQPKTGLNQTQRAAAAQSASPNQQAQGDDVQKAAPVQPKTGLNQTQRAAAAQSASPNQQAQGDDVQRAGQDPTERDARK